MQDYVFEKDQYFGKIHNDYVKYFKRLPRLFRLTGKSNRIYFTKERGKPAVVYTSGTTLIDNFHDKSGAIALESWRKRLLIEGLDPAVVLKTRQDYGTILHIIYGKLLMKEEMSYQLVSDIITKIAIEDVGMKEEKAEEFVSKHLTEFKKDIGAFVQWLIDFEVEPIAIEAMMKTDKYMTATAIDLVANITVQEKGFYGEVYKSGANKGKPKQTVGKSRKRVIVDFKSGKGSGFYPKNILQLLLNRVIWEENFPEVKLDGIYNFSPKNWRTSPTYEFADQERESKQTTYLNSIKENVFERGLKEFTEETLNKRELVMEGNVYTPYIAQRSLHELADTYFDREVVDEE